MSQEISRDELGRVMREASRLARLDLDASRVEVDEEAYRGFWEAIQRLESFALEPEREPALLFQPESFLRGGE